MRKVSVAVLVTALVGVPLAGWAQPDLQTLLAGFLKDLYTGTIGNTSGVNVAFKDGTLAAPSLAFNSETGLGLYRSSSGHITQTNGSNAGVDLSTSTGLTIASNLGIGWSSTVQATGTQDTQLGRTAAGVIGTGSTSLTTIGADVTTVSTGDFTRQRYQATITPATGGTGNCGTAFKAAALTADCTIATLPAGMKLVGVYADVTTGLTCAATCSGTKTISVGKTAGGTEFLTSGLSVVTTNTQFGLLDADLGTAMVRAAAIQGGSIQSWSATTPVIVRFTSGTGNWGTGAATNVNAGSIKFTLVVEQIK